MTFLTPFAAFAALAALVPIAAGAFGAKRAATVRRALGLPAPAHSAGLLRRGLAVSAIALLGLAAAQPTLSHASRRRARTDVQALFVLDTSRSMAASATPTSPTRLDRSLAAAARLRAAIPDVAAGVATLTDRVLPDLLPVPDADGFDAVLERAVAIDRPPPRETSVRATTYSALTSVASGNYFERGITRRIVVLLTDGESNPIDPGEIARALSEKQGYRLLIVRFWRSNDAVYGSNGTPELAYRPDSAGRAIVAAVAAADGGRAFEQDQLGAASRYLFHLAGRGPTRLAPGTERSRRSLAPYVAIAALLLLVASLWPGRANRPVVPHLAGKAQRPGDGKDRRAPNVSAYMNARSAESATARPDGS